MKKNIILITGGAGFIGSSLIKYFVKLKLKENIISIDNYSSGSIKNHIKSNKVKYIKGENKDIDFILKRYKKAQSTTTTQKSSAAWTTTTTTEKEEEGEEERRRRGDAC